MANALDYIKWRGDISFEAAPINEVDVFLCSQIAMVDFEGIVSGDGKETALADAADRYFIDHDTDVRNLGVLQSAGALPAFQAMSRSNRFRSIMLSHYVNIVSDEFNEQFSATVFRFSPEVYAVVFRGTDDSIIGWKEDCHLAIYDQVPAQADALAFLNRVAGVLPGRMIVAGHSKGGNLAVYAASNADSVVQDRIVYVYSYDGPGFPKKFIEDHSGYAAVKERVTTIVSQNSIVGLMLETAGRIAYTQSHVDGLYAHDGFSWEVEVNHFLRLSGLSRFSNTLRDIFKRVMEKMSAEEKKDFVDELFDIIFDTGADTLTEFRDLGWKASLGAFTGMTSSKAIREFFNSFLVSMVNKNNDDHGLKQKE